LLKLTTFTNGNNPLISHQNMFTEADLILIKECLLKRVNENLKKFRKYSEADLNSLKIVEKINLFVSVKQA